VRHVGHLPRIFTHTQYPNAVHHLIMSAALYDDN